MAVPFRIRPQEAVGLRYWHLHLADGFCRDNQGLGYRCCLELQAPQHARRVAAETVISLSDMSQWIVGQRIAELRTDRDELFEPTPFRRFGDRHFQWHTIIAGFK